MDMMAVSLGTAAIASYLLLRGSRPRIAILISHSLAAASIWTHPCGLLLAALLVVLILYLDRHRLRLGDLGLALVPYVLAAGLWSLYIAQAPADFISQFGGNVSGFAGEYTYQHRFAGLCAPLEALHREWSLRYLPGLRFCVPWLEGRMVPGNLARCGSACCPHRHFSSRLAQATPDSNAVGCGGNCAAPHDCL